MRHIVNINEAKTHFSKLVGLVLQGEEIVITKAGKPAAKLIPIATKKTKRPFGILKGKLWIADDFDAPLDEFF